MHPLLSTSLAVSSPLSRASLRLDVSGKRRGSWETPPTPFMDFSRRCRLVDATGASVHKPPDLKTAFIPLQSDDWIRRLHTLPHTTPYMCTKIIKITESLHLYLFYLAHVHSTHTFYILVNMFLHIFVHIFYCFCWVPYLYRFKLNSCHKFFIAEHNCYCCVCDNQRLVDLRYAVELFSPC